ncbi:unnamed protein product, partial [Polarella glacialis]
VGLTTPSGNFDELLTSRRIRSLSGSLSGFVRGCLSVTTPDGSPRHSPLMDPMCSPTCSLSTGQSPLGSLDELGAVLLRDQGSEERGPSSSHAKEPEATLFASWCVLTNTLLGVGILGLPWAISSVGLALGAGMLFGAGIVAAFALHLLSALAMMLVRGSQGPADVTFYSVCMAVAPGAKHVVDVAIALKCFGVATSYLQVIGELGTSLVAEVLGWSTDPNQIRYWIIILAVGVVIAPTVFHKRITKT